MRSRMADLLDRCFGADELSGVDWLELIEFLVTSQNLLPTRHWHLLATRLLTEMSVSVGWHYLHRLTALHRLHCHPEAGRVLVPVIAEFITSRSCQVIADPLALLAASPQPSAQPVLMRPLRCPPDEHHLRAAMVAWSVRTTPTSDDVVRRIAAAAAGHLLDPGQPPAVRRAAADLLATCPADRLDTGVRHIRRGLRVDQDLRAVLNHRALITPTSNASVVTTLAKAVQDADDDGSALPGLIHQALYSTNSDAKVNAVNVLGASPFRATLVAAACRHLAELDSTRRPDDVAALADLVGSLGDATHRQSLESVLTTPAPGAVVAAAEGLAHLPGRTDSATWLRVLALHQRPDIVRAVAYAAGMNQDRATLWTLRADARVSQRVTWWLHLPVAAQRSARR
ncbi:hypothetical protein [Amycolatopsis sp. NPDC098790]|uniref:hypothetical protein n=1 Tax=Amycolatopsis sp. NPDC098790 TaxID=3363939 RepID=UPI00382C29DB